MHQILSHISYLVTMTQNPMKSYAKYFYSTFCVNIKMSIFSELWLRSVQKEFHLKTSLFLSRNYALLILDQDNTPTLENTAFPTSIESASHSTTTRPSRDWFFFFMVNGHISKHALAVEYWMQCQRYGVLAPQTNHLPFQYETSVTLIFAAPWYLLCMNLIFATYVDITSIISLLWYGLAQQL